MEYILAFSAESSINEIDILKKISDYIKSVGSQLTLHPPSNILDEDKKKHSKIFMNLVWKRKPLQISWI
jgi:hypothetical protein